MSTLTRRWVGAPLLAATCAIAASAWTQSGVADAQPEWDIAQYDNCITSFPDNPSENVLRFYDHIRWCCEKSGGIWQGGRYGTCVAPPADPKSAIHTRVPASPIHGDLPPISSPPTHGTGTPVS